MLLSLLSQELLRHLKVVKKTEMVTSSFLEIGHTINADANTAEKSSLFLWFKGDFGGRRGTMKIISKYLFSDEN